MLIYKCSKCHWIGDNPDVYTDTEYCPRCRTTESLHIVHQKEAECFTSDELETLWELFGEIPINDNDEIEDYFFDFPAGTDRFEIWLWFDGLYPEGVAKLTGTI